MSSLGEAIRLEVKKNQGNFTLDCELDISDGITAIFGPSGSGKTTLLDCIAGFLTPDEGSISKFERTIFSSDQSIDIPPDKRGIGYVVQNSALFPHLTVKENINYGFSLTPKRKRKYSLEKSWKYSIFPICQKERPEIYLEVSARGWHWLDH